MPSERSRGPGGEGPEDELPTRADPHIGKLIAGKYRLVSFVARGGMGTIYRAEQTPLGRTVAVKLLNRRDTDESAEFERRFFLEASMSAKVSHPNVVTVYDYGRTETDNLDTYFMVLEFLEGRTLAHALDEAGTLPHGSAIRIIRSVARGLRAAHKLSVIHRDLKPSNIMLVESDEGEQVKVLDFGIAKVVGEDYQQFTMNGRLVGSPRYISPEQVENHPVDARTDLYSLGIVFYEMLAGRVPFERQSVAQVLIAHLNDPPPTIKERSGIIVDPAVEGLVMRCLAKHPEQRFANVDVFLRALENVAGSLGISFESPTVASGSHAAATLPPDILEADEKITPALWAQTRLDPPMALAPPPPQFEPLAPQLEPPTSGPTPIIRPGRNRALLGVAALLVVATVAAVAGFAFDWTRGATEPDPTPTLEAMATASPSASIPVATNTPERVVVTTPTSTPTPRGTPPKAKPQKTKVDIVLER